MRTRSICATFGNSTLDMDAARGDFTVSASDNGHGRFRPDWKFYRQLAIVPFAQKPRLWSLSITALMAITQLANCAGFFYESRRRNPDRPHPIKDS